MFPVAHSTPWPNTNVVCGVYAYEPHDSRLIALKGAHHEIGNDLRIGADLTFEPLRQVTIAREVEPALTDTEDPIRAHSPDSE
jgi:hypothetical protein